MFPGGLTYSGHPLACAAAVASINAMTDEGIIDNARRLGADVLGPGLREIGDRHPSVGEVRGLGVFWALDLVKDKATREMLVPYNASGEANEPMAALVAACKERGLLPFVNFNRLHVVPPCTITDEEAKEGLGDPRRRARRGRPIRHRLITGTVAPMSYDIFFVRRDPGQTFEDALDGVEESYESGDPGPLTEDGPRAVGGRAAAGARDPRRPGRDHPARRGDPGAHRPGHRHRHHAAGGGARDPRPGPPGRRATAR